MPRENANPVRRCQSCDRDWPNAATYNLCPRCQKCTFASLAADRPDSTTAQVDAARFKRYRDFDASVDAGTLRLVPDAWAKEMNDLLKLTPAPGPTNYGLAGGTTRDA